MRDCEADGRSRATLQHLLGLLDDLRVYCGSHYPAEKGEVGGGVIQHAREGSAAEVEEGRVQGAQLGAVRLQPVQGRKHGEKDSDEENGNLLDGVEGKVVRLMDLSRGGEVRASGRGDHDDLAKEFGM